MKQEKKKIDSQNLFEGLIAFIISFTVVGFLIGFPIYHFTAPAPEKVYKGTNTNFVTPYNTESEDMYDTYYTSAEDILAEKAAKSTAIQIGVFGSLGIHALGYGIYRLHQNRQTKKYKRTS